MWWLTNRALARPWPICCRSYSGTCSLQTAWIDALSSSQGLPGDGRSVVPCEVVAPTSNLVQQIAEVARVAASRSARGFQVSGSPVKVLGRWG